MVQGDFSLLQGTSDVLQMLSGHFRYTSGTVQDTLGVLQVASGNFRVNSHMCVGKDAFWQAEPSFRAYFSELHIN